MKYQEIEHMYLDHEKVDLNKFYKFVLEEMSFKDFKKFFKLRFMEKRRDSEFEYFYNILEEDDSKELRKEYLQYLAFKYLQNTNEEGIELI